MLNIMNHSPIPVWYYEIFERYRPILQQKSALYIALSAGVDSNTLLHWLYTFKAELPPITSIHVNHNWHGEDSHTWANFARERSESYGFTHIHYDIYFDDHNPQGLEAAGREARYLKFGETMVENSLLCVGHHRSDQAETLFQRLLRSAGVRGMGAMRDFTTVQFGPYAIELFRPFLSISKKELYRTARRNNLPWLEDYTNHEADEMERNIIRNDLFKTLEKQFPFYEEAFYKTSQFMQEADELLMEIAAEDLHNLSQFPERSSPLSATSLFKNRVNRNHRNSKTVESIDRDALLRLSPRRQKNVLQYWLRQQNLTFTQEQMREFYRSFIESPPTHQSYFPLVRFSIRFYRGRLYLLPDNDQEREYRLTWKNAKNAPLETFWQSQNVVLKKRQGGERFHPLGRSHSQALKKLLQSANLPTWERDECYYLENNQGDILWVNLLGLSKMCENALSDEGVLPYLEIQENE